MNVIRPRAWADSFMNLMAGLGVPGRDKFTGQQYTYTPLTQYDLDTAYRGDWIARKCVDIPAFDMTRQWRSWQAERDQITVIEKVEKELLVQNRLQLALIQARLYGGSIIIIGVDQGTPEEELDVEAISEGDLKWLHVLPMYQVGTGPTVLDITSPYWAQPSYYTANTSAPTQSNKLPQTMTAQQQVKLHPSRVVRLIGLPPPDQTKTYWGDSVLQPINDTIKACGLVAGSIATLVSELKVDVIKIPNLNEALATDDGTNALTRRFSTANVAKSVINTILIDSNEEWDRVQASLGGTDAILNMYLQIAAGAADIPVTRFLGVAPGGLQSTGDADTRNYYDRLKSEQSTVLQPALYKLDQVILRSALGSNPDEKIWYEWNSLWQMDENERADLAIKKAQAYQVDVNAGQIPSTALAQARINQLIEDGTYPGLEQAIDDAEAAGDTVEEKNTPQEVPPELGGPVARAFLPAPPGKQLEEGDSDVSRPFGWADDKYEYIVEYVDDVDDRRRGGEKKGHPFRGNQYVTGVSSGKAYEGKQESARVRLSKLETGVIGEGIAQDYLRSIGIRARSLNDRGNNFPIDLYGGGVLWEVKAGQASNGRSAQQWRVTLGKPGPAETKWLRRASKDAKRKWNAGKADRAIARKHEAAAKLAKEYGRKLDKRTIAIILNTSTGTADIHQFEGFHKRIGWNTPEAAKGYKRSVRWRRRR